MMAVALKGKTHKEVIEVFANNWMYRIGVLELLVLDNKFVSQAVQQMC